MQTIIQQLQVTQSGRTVKRSVSVPSTKSSALCVWTEVDYQLLKEIKIFRI